MRPKKTRWITCSSDERCFRPECKKTKDMEGVTLTLDEYEVIKLCDLDHLDQKEIAMQMKVHRSTVSRMLTSARNKVADALVNLKAIKIKGGCCQEIKKD